jgi:uncharacterized protein YutE (UPF0331/DUF86 family)
VPDADAARPLPREIRIRLVDVPRHLRALEFALEQFEDEDEFAEAARSKDPRELGSVYAVERPFELLDNYNVELARRGLIEACLRRVDDDATAKSNFWLLADGGVIPKTLADRLIDVHELRNQLAHEYPDVRARQVYEAAYALRAAVAPFFDALLKWLARPGFAVPRN